MAHGVRLSEDESRARLALFKSTNFNTSETARQLGISRQSLLKAVERWKRDNWISEDDLDARENMRSVEEVARARDVKVRAFKAKQAKGDWRKPVLVNLPSEPFRLKLFGDPHLESDGTDFELFEEQWMDMGPGVYGICVGDWFNNWVRALAGIYAEETTRPSDGWILLNDLMEKRGEFLLAGCSGNHDDWAHGPVDPVADLMRRHGVRYRKGAIRLALHFKDINRTITAAIRHKWAGRSIYSPGHGLKRAAMWGWRDHISAGGHIHVDDLRVHVHPDDGFKQHCFQISAFKKFDDYPDVHGFMSHSIQPFVDLVIDPRRADDDIEMVKAFWDSKAAAAYLRAVRESN